MVTVSKPSGSDGSKYTNPTGDGYLGIWKTSGNRAVVAIGTFTCVDWLSTDDVFAVDVDQERAIAVAEETDGGAVICKLRVVKNGVGTAVQVHNRALGSLDGFEPGMDIRAYRRDAGGFYLVPAEADPFVDGGATSDV